jgi:hypothetical protein
MLRRTGAEVEAIEADLATTEGVDKLYAAGRGRYGEKERTPGRTWPGDRLPNRPGLLAYSERMT